jgi:hypothetical protein
MERDKHLIGEFLRGYNQHFGTTFRITELPDQLQRREKAVDALAEDATGQKLAIEHTLIQPFLGEKDDAQRLLSVIAPLESDPSLRLPGKSIDVSVGVRAVPQGPDWKRVGAGVVAWFRAIRLSLPDGQSTHEVPNVGFDLTLRIEKDDSPRPEGRIFVMRSGIPEMPRDFESVIRIALKEKLSKLLAEARADKRILLLEKDNTPRGYNEIGNIIDSFKGDFQELSVVNDVWVMNTVGWTSEGCLFFYHVWPGGVTGKFGVRCESTRALQKQ